MQLEVAYRNTSGMLGPQGGCPWARRSCRTDAGLISAGKVLTARSEQPGGPRGRSNCRTAQLAGQHPRGQGDGADAGRTGRGTGEEGGEQREAGFGETPGRVEAPHLLESQRSPVTTRRTPTALWLRRASPWHRPNPEPVRKSHERTGNRKSSLLRPCPAYPYGLFALSLYLNCFRALQLQETDSNANILICSGAEEFCPVRMTVTFTLSMLPTAALFSKFTSGFLCVPSEPVFNTVLVLSVISEFHKFFDTLHFL